MNVSGSLSAIQYNSALSSLRSANRQPELALELLLKSVESIQSTPRAQSPQAVVQPSTSTSDIGQFIDIIV